MDNRVRKTLATAFELPMDVMLRMPVIHITGDALVEIENHQGLREYTDRRIRLGSGAGPITVTGENMLVESIQSERIVIRGRIAGVRYRAEGE